MNDITHRLDEIEARANAATEGPWNFGTGTEEPLDLAARIEWVADTLGYGNEKRHLWATWRPDGESEGRVIVPALTGDGPNAHHNAEFIAHARSDVPALLAFAREVAEVLDEGWTRGKVLPRMVGAEDQARVRALRNIAARHFGGAS
jgi:hypothetical protein